MTAGPAAVASTAGLAWRLTTLILWAVVQAVVLAARSVMAWAQLMAGRPGEDTVMVLRRRKWIALTAAAVPLAGATLIAPGPMLRTVGWIPMAASLPLLAGAVWRARRLTRRSHPATRPAPPAAPAAPVVSWGDYHPTARSTEVEQALGDLLHHLAAAGLTVDTALYAARAMPQRSQLWLLTIADANLAALAQPDSDGSGFGFGATEAAVWLFPFCQALRTHVGLATNVTSEPNLPAPRPRP